MLHNPNLNSLMRGRLGLYSLQPGQDAGVEDRKEQFKQQGGYHQQERMIKDKLKSLEKACLYSYQAGEVRDINAKVLNTYRALINPNKLKQDYDDKIISIQYEAGFKELKRILTTTLILIFPDPTEPQQYEDDT